MKREKRIFHRSLSWTLIILSFCLSACSLFTPNRTYMEEMDDDSEGLIVPGEDFPIVDGDRKKSQSDKSTDLLLRTPKTPVENKKISARKALQEELSGLEDALPEADYQHYLRHQRKMANTSERIFFLRLRNMRERDDYLFGKGRQYSDEEVVSPLESQAIRDREILMGMSKEAVVQSWGNPMRVDVAGRPEHQNERWAFSDYQGKIKYVFFEGGLVKGWVIE